MTKAGRQGVCVACVGVALVALTWLLLVAVKNGKKYGLDFIDAIAVPFLDGTKWAPGFTEEQFVGVAAGMTENQVRERLGDCLTKLANPTTGEELWHYTVGKDGRAMSDSRYSTHLRIVRVGTNGLVVGKTATFYFD